MFITSKENLSKFSVALIIYMDRTTFEIALQLYQGNIFPGLSSLLLFLSRLGIYQYIVYFI